MWPLGLRNFLTWTDLLVFTLILVVTWIVYNLMVRPVLSPLYKIPGKRGSLLQGSMNEHEWKSRDPYEYCLKLMEELKVKSIFRVHWFFGWTSICVATPETYKYVSVLNNKNYPKPDIVYKPLSEVFGKGLVVLNGEEHAVQRKLCLYAFKYNVLKSLAGKFDDHSKKLVELWEGKIGINNTLDMLVDEDLSRAAFDSITDACFDLKTSVLHDSNSEVSKAARWLLKCTNSSLLKFLPYHQYLPIPQNWTFNKKKKLVDNLIEDMIEKRREIIKTWDETDVLAEGLKHFSFNSDENKADNLLTMLLLAEDEEDGRKLTKQQVRDQMLTFLFAGHETTATTMVWGLWSLALNPNVQEKARKEIMSVIPDLNEPITANHLDRMPYLTCVIKETLRTHTVVPIVPRVALNDDYIDGYFIPKGTFIFLLLSTIHHNPEYWDDPEMFIPERFEDESKIKPFTFIPFTSGPRMCIGYKMAMMELQMFFANMLRRFEFSPTPGMEHIGKTFFTTQKPSKPILFKVRNVNQQLI